MPGPRDRRVDRRSVLAVAGAMIVGAGGTAYLAAHGLRLEHDAPGPDLLPRAPYPGAAALRAELGRCAQAAHAAEALVTGGEAQDRDAALGSALGEVHTAQVEALRGRLAEVGVDPSPPGDPTEPVTGPAPAPGAPTAALPAPGEPTGAAPAVEETSGPDSGPRARLLAAQTGGRTPDDLAVIAAAPGADRRLVVSTSVGRGAAACLLRPRPVGDPVTATAPGLAVLPRDVRLALLASARAGEYGLQVAAAQAGEPETAAARAALDVTARLESDLADTLGGDAPPPSLGHPLSYPVTTPEAADRLGREVLDRLVAAVVEAAPAAPPRALDALLVRGVALEAARTGWGAAHRPLPGLA